MKALIGSGCVVDIELSKEAKGELYNLKKELELPDWMNKVKC